MKYSINIDHKLKLLRYPHSGIINAEDIEKAWNEFLTFRTTSKISPLVSAAFSKQISQY